MQNVVVVVVAVHRGDVHINDDECLYWGQRSISDPYVYIWFCAKNVVIATRTGGLDYMLGILI